MTQERNNELPTMEDPLHVDNSFVVDSEPNNPFTDRSLDGGDYETEAAVSGGYIVQMIPAEAFESTEQTEHCGTALITQKVSVEKFI
ncbi:unnamed protein product [Staurois parvus]|uniref:Uncharacterized protein n=1 Tax=Staurois parvus TaxID=386267 RepID=A0ABN9CWV8_9NEOB|nr:unnamed protein product [Staurois parvus]